MSGTEQGTAGIELSDLLSQVFNSFMSDVHTAMPGSVESYESSTKKVSAKPLIKKKFKNGDVLDMPIISNIPVLFMGSKKSVLQFELERGDTGLLIFSERALEYWLSGSGSAMEPGDPRKFSMTDAMFIPGLFPFNSPGKVSGGAALELLNENASIKMTTTDVEINGNTKNFVTHTELDTALQNMVTALNTELGKISLAIAGLGGSYTVTPVTIDISTSKTETVKTG